MMASKRRSRLVLGIALASAAAVGCALTFEPGSYTGGGGTSAEGGLDGALSEGGPGPGPDGETDAAPGRAGFMLVFGGERDVATGGTASANEVWLGEISETGGVTGWSYLQPTPQGGILVGTITRGFVVGAQRATAAIASLGGRAVDAGAAPPDSDGGMEAGTATGDASAPDADVELGSWRTVLLRQDVAYDAPGYMFTERYLLGLGGGGSVAVDGGTQYRVLDTVRLSEVDPAAGTFAPWVDSPTRLPAPIRAMGLAEDGNRVYLVGGTGTAPDQRSRVYVSSVDEDAGVGLAPFREVTQMRNPMTAQPYMPDYPTTCVAGGRLWVIGGGVSTGSSDIVLVSKIDPATGDLGVWERAPNLPTPLRFTTCAVYGGALHLVGGQGATSRSERIYRIDLTAGANAAWEIAPGAPMPSPRSKAQVLLF